MPRKAKARTKSGKTKKVKVGLKSVHLVLIVAALAVVAGGYFGFNYYQEELAPVTIVDYKGVDLPFRIDVREANTVEVRPDVETLRRAIDKPPTVVEGNLVVVRPSLDNVVIAFKSEGVSQETLGYYTVEATEIIKKLTLLYRSVYEVPVTFNVLEVENYDELEGSNSRPIIALIHPDIAEGTFVSIDEERDVITVSGGDSLEDFDLATVRLMSIALGIDQHIE